MSELMLPEGWVSSSIGNVNTYKSKNIKPFDFSDTVFELYSVPVFFSGYPEILEGKEIGSSKSVVEKDDVLICKINPRINRVWVVQDYTEHSNIASSEWIVFRQPLLNPKFMKHYYQSLEFRDKLCADVSGVGGSLTRAKPREVAKYLLPIAPIAEQNKISQLLDTYLTTVSQIQARLDAIPKLIEKFRQSVLNDAVSGKLTENWRHKNGLDYHFKLVTLDEILDIDVGYAFKSKDFTDKGIKLLRGANIAPQYLKWDDTKYIPEQDLEGLRHLYLNENDIVLAMDRPIVNSGLKIAKVSKKDLPCALVQRVARFTNLQINSEYLWICLNDIQFINYLFPNQTGSDIPHISGKQILKYQISMPPLVEQEEVVKQVNDLLVHADQIEKNVAAAKARVDNLTQSILHQAFTGKLTEEWRKQNPELITGDNSAEALLAKIEAEKKESKAKKKK